MRQPIDTVIDAEACSSCGECVRVCPSQAITMRGRVAVVTGEWSLGCGHCAAVCPTGAVAVGSLEYRLGLETVAENEPTRLPEIGSLVALMRSRRSCRNFQKKLVPRPVLEDLVRIATTAPSGTNCQPWTFTIAPDHAAVERLAAAVGGFFERLNRKAASPAYRTLARLLAGDALGRYYREYYESVEEGLRQWREEGRDRLFHGAPAVILVGCTPGASCPAEDALLATGHILLAAQAMGLGTCLIGFAVAALRQEPQLKRPLGLPSEEDVYSVIAIGYPDESYLRPAGRRPVTPRYMA